MAMRIIPAILAERENDFFFLMRQAETFTDYVQIDIMDGFFVPSRSFPVTALRRLTTPLSFELHLMVKHPSAFMVQVDHPRLKSVIYHVEADVEHLDFIGQVKNRGAKAGLAVKPETRINDFAPLVAHVDTILFMTVDPGYYGSPFKPDVVEKISDARRRFLNVEIGVDGGVSLDNIHVFVDAHVDYACVGSRIFSGNNPGDNYREFLRRTREIESP